MEHEICFFNSTAHEKHQQGQEPIDPRPQKEGEKTGFFSPNQEEKNKPGDRGAAGIQGKRSSRGSTRRSSPAVAGAGVAIAGSKEVERETARGERRGRSRGVGVVGEER